MRNMGRLFQYNRFGANDTNSQDSKKDTPSLSCLTTNKPQRQFDANCPPPYIELYPDFVSDSIEITTTPRAFTTTIISSTETTKTTTTETASTPMATSMTSRSIDLALRKYQQWSSKFLPTTNNTMPLQTATATATTTITTPQIASNTDSVTHLSSTSSSQKSNSCSHSTLTAGSSGYYSKLTIMGNEREQQQQNHWNNEEDRELLVNVNKRPKVYDCMKDFLRRKLFQQRHGQQEELQQQQSTQLDATLCNSDTEEDVTSDYDEIDMLDSSYNADEEDASDCSSQYTLPLESDNDDAEQTQGQSSREEQKYYGDHNSIPQKLISPQKSMISLTCWQNISQYSDSTTEPEQQAMEDELPSELKDKVVDYENIAEDSDAGISDCCQLISEKTKSTKQQSKQVPQNLSKKQKQKLKKQRGVRYNRNSHEDDEEDELLTNSWYQPRITTKAALDHLQQALPGTFLLRRKSRTYELCLRAETKVKHFIVVTLADNHYKLKGAKKQFTSLKALVTHHSVMAEQLPLTLTLPREYEYNKNKTNAYTEPSNVDGQWTNVSAKTLKSLRYGDDFDTYESLQILDLLQNWQY